MLLLFFSILHFDDAGYDEIPVNVGINITVLIKQTGTT